MLAKQVEVLQQLRRLLGGPAATAEPALPPQQDQYWPRSAYVPPELRGQLDPASSTSPQQQESEQESTRCRYIPPELRGLP